MVVQLFIEHNKTIYQPAVEEGIIWETERKNSPSKLTFTVVKDYMLDFTEGDAVILYVNGENVFYGFVFTKNRNKEHRIKVTAYDQMRYLKNKFYYSETYLTATNFIKNIIQNYELNAGELEDTKYVIESISSTNSTFIDAIQDTLDKTLQNTGKLYVFYDDFGHLTLKSIDNMFINDILINESISGDFDYTTSIDEETYNKITLYYDYTEDTGTDNNNNENNTTSEKKRLPFSKEDINNINKWGLLEYSEEIKDTTNVQNKLETLLSLYNRRTRHLNINNIKGDLRVRAGSLVPVNMFLGDIQVNNIMLVEKCRHEFYESQHIMDLTLRGGLVKAKDTEFEQ